ncbi:MAG TPA: serine/threonine-protein kinase [Kofleriaceae bacterium]|nr:serine/threonine-protein kinase [Kofleriaceae bacterium]
MGFAGLDYGRTIGRYSIVQRLSVGGMAEIFLALATGPGEFRKFVTLKRILPNLREDDAFVQMFLEEARISASLSHANIAQVFDLRSEGDELYLAMEYIAGEDVSQILRITSKRHTFIPTGLTAMIVRDSCNALHYAHNFVDPLGEHTPVIHRDIAPKNVMMTYSGAVKVVDFGIAKMRRPRQLLTTTSVKGSSGYMSPEQLAGMSVDARSDIFALGVLMHELLAGRRLFVADRPDVEPELDPDRITPPHLVNPAVPEAMSAIVMRALDFDPARRFTSARAMARAIEDATPDIFDEERAAAFMRSLFASRIEMVRMLLRSATEHPEALRAVVAKLDEHGRGDPGSGSPTPIEGPSGSAAAAAAAGTRDVVARRARILAVDDSVSSLHVLRIQLGRVGLEVIPASTPAEAFAELERVAPEAIILDVVMPEMTGYEMCRLIRERDRFRQTPILFLSAACSLEERIRGLEVGGDDFIRKPCDPQELALRVRSHLARVAVLGEQGRV